MSEIQSPNPPFSNPEAFQAADLENFRCGFGGVDSNLRSWLKTGN